MIFKVLIVILSVIVAPAQHSYASPQQPKFICEIFLTNNIISENSLSFLRNIKEKQPEMLLLAYGPDDIKSSNFIKQRIATLNLSTSRPVIIFNGAIVIAPGKNNKWRQQCTKIIKQLSTPSPGIIDFSLSTRLSKNGKLEVQFHACNLQALKSFSGKVLLWEIWNKEAATTVSNNNWTNIRQLYGSSVNLPPYAVIKKCPLPEWFTTENINEKKQWQMVGILLGTDGKIKVIDRVSAESTIKDNDQ